MAAILGSSQLNICAFSMLVRGPKVKGQEYTVTISEWSTKSAGYGSVRLDAAYWSDLWHETSVVRRHRNKTNNWANRARHLDLRSKLAADKDPQSYISQLLRLLSQFGVKRGDIVLDMGCGNGGLSFPLAQRGCKVIAADAEPLMLEHVRNMAAELVDRSDDASHGLDDSGLKTAQLAWQDSWEARGLASHSVDVAIASRSLDTDNLQATLGKFTDVARKFCVLVVSTDMGEHVDSLVLSKLGLPQLPIRDHQIIWNLLTGIGFLPSCAYIRATKPRRFADTQEAAAWAGRMLEDVEPLYTSLQLMDAHNRLIEWAQSLPVDEGGNPYYRQTAQWACIAWDAEKGL